MVSDTFLDIVPVESLHERLGLSAPLNYPSELLFKPMAEWRTEVDDAPILRYLYRHLQPARHLEFGPADGANARLCLEECQASVWTINPILAHRDSSIAAHADTGNSSGYSAGFFDSALINGGPGVDVVSTATRTALSLVRPGGLIVWRDFCPDPALFDSFDSVAAVVGSVLRDRARLSASVQDAFWIRPSFLLTAIRR
jgi:hypothetical protein